ncbi:unnamed protein product [Cladocopium goreaui]|uniref:Modification methylase HgiCII n=1 Tax=Cladocopium goreaui TaxID=2562237 RepID=A0A9P1C1I6_9DINO|nr:unnamed protein product [Cladocopium goreaui]
MQVHLAQPGCFLFEILVQMQLPLIRKVIDLTGKILPVDLRVWHPMAVKTLDEAPWTLRPGSFRCANGFPHTAHFGLHDGQVWCGLQNLIQAVTPPAHAVFAVHPAFAQALTGQPAIDSPKPTRCGKNTAEAFGHWTLLWGHQVSTGLCWTHFNGFSSPCSQEAHRLAKAISNALGLDFHPPHSKSWIAQIDSNTCGTVALVHLFQLLNPGLMVPPTAIKLIHEWILAHPALQGRIFAQGLADLSTDQMAKLKQLLFDHGVPEAKVDERAKFVVQKLEAPAIIELTSEQLEKFNMTKISFPATYKGTGEPVLIFGSLKNLGDKKINRHMIGAKTQIDTINTAVIRIHAYKDELQAQWQDLVKSPVRLISTIVPQLQLCAGEGCGQDCPKSHPAIGENLDSITMEVWGRSFGKLEGGRAPAAEATYFSVYIRVPESILKSLLQSNITGIYLDPRQDKSPDERYRVIWLSVHTLAEAQHSLKTCAKALGLVRLRHKYGLRVETVDEEAAFKFLKPDATYIATRVQRTFQLFPLPHGLQRAGLIKILTDLEWVAKPLQPGRGQQDGISWMVGSTTAPPVAVFSSFGKEVLITETTKQQAPTKPLNFLASTKTQKHLRTEAGSSTMASTDPWQDASADPWNSWKPTSGENGASKPAAGESHLADITNKLRDEIQTTMRKELDDYKSSQDATMAEHDDAATEQRFARIESTLGEIQAQQGQFNQWVTQVGEASTATETAIQTINYTLSMPQQELHGLHHEIKNVSDSVGQTLQKTLASHQTEMSADFAARFDKLAAMFAKKHCSE